MQLLWKYVSKHYLFVVIAAVLLGNPFGAWAQIPPPPVCLSKDLILLPNDHKDRKGFTFQMGDRLRIEATGGCFNVMKAELAKAQSSKGFQLFLSNVNMANLTVNPLEIQGTQQLILTFYLTRNSQDDLNREAWDILLGKQPDTFTFKSELSVALAVGSELPWKVTHDSSDKVEFYIAADNRVWGTFAVGAVIFLLVYYRLVKNPNALRDAPNGPYSLGKSQMAFWGLLVVLTFAGIFSMTFTMERIPPQVLILIGISGATGLSAIAIGENKKSNAVTELQSELDKLKQEQQTLEKQKASVGATFPPVSEVRLGEIKARMDELSRAAPSTASGGFWQDICDDGNGMSFHRLQVVIWTIVLGVIFVHSVTRAISMPEFSQTLLALLGISNGTYLGFKIPEKT